MLKMTECEADAMGVEKIYQPSKSHSFGDFFVKFNFIATDYKVAKPFLTQSCDPSPLRHRRNPTSLVRNPAMGTEEGTLHAKAENARKRVFLGRTLQHTESVQDGFKLTEVLLPQENSGAHLQSALSSLYSDSLQVARLHVTVINIVNSMSMNCKV